VLIYHYGGVPRYTPARWQHGEIKQIRLVTQKSGRSRGFAYIEFTTAVRAIDPPHPRGSHGAWTLTLRRLPRSPSRVARQQEAAAKATAALNQTEVEGRRISVELSRPKDPSEAAAGARGGLLPRRGGLFVPASVRQAATAASAPAATSASDNASADAPAAKKSQADFRAMLLAKTKPAESSS